MSNPMTDQRPEIDPVMRLVQAVEQHCATYIGFIDGRVTGDELSVYFKAVHDAKEDLYTRLARDLTTALRSEGTGVARLFDISHAVENSISYNPQVTSMDDEIGNISRAVYVALTHEAGTAGEDGA